MADTTTLESGAAVVTVTQEIATEKHHLCSSLATPKFMIKQSSKTYIVDKYIF